MNIIQATTNNFLFVDQVPANWKPTGTTQEPNDNGIRVELISNATGGHLRIEGRPDDELFRIVESSASSATVEVRPDIGSSTIGNSRFGSGVNKLTIQTDGGITGDPGDAIVRVTTAEPQGGSPPPTYTNLPGLHPNTQLRIESRGANDEIHIGGAQDASVHAVVRTGKGNNKVFLLQDKNPDGQTTTAIVDFDPTLGSGGLGTGHLLKVGSDQFGPTQTGVNCAAILQQVGTTAHDITVDRVEVRNDKLGIVSVFHFPATVIVSDPTLIGEMVVGPDMYWPTPIVWVNAPLEVSPSTSTNGIALVEGRMQFAASSAPSTVHEFAVVGNNATLSAGVVNVNAGADLTVLKRSRFGNLNVLGTNAKVLLEDTIDQNSAPTHIRDLTITSGGLLTVKARGLDPMRPLRVNTMDLDKASSPTGKLDLKDNALIVDYDNDSPIEQVRELIGSAFNGGGANAWTGNGLTTSLGDASTYALGYVENDPTLGGFGFTSFAGVAVDASSVLVRYAFFGDANFDGNVNLQDFNRLAANFGQSGKHWADGDFTYDGIVGIPDFNRLAANFGQGTTFSTYDDYTPQELEDMLPD